MMQPNAAFEPPYVALVWGGGDLGTGVAHALHQARRPEPWKVVVAEQSLPTALRFRAAFASAVLHGTFEVEGVRAVHATTFEAVEGAWRRGEVAVFTGGWAALHERYAPTLLVDCRLRGIADNRLRLDLAPVVIGLGPGIRAGEDADAVIETNRDDTRRGLGAVIWEGEASPHTGIPGVVAGETRRRILRAPAAGRLVRVRQIGDLVVEGETVATVSGEPVRAQLAGVVRGLKLDGVEVPAGKKVGDVDPRGADLDLDRMTDKARRMGASVLEAVTAALARRTEATKARGALREF